MMEKTSKLLTKQKFPHSSAKLLYLETFLISDVVHYFIQCETKEVFVGINNVGFKIVWSGNIKQRVSCICYCDEARTIYAGTIKGTIAIISLGEEQTQQCGKIDAINGEHILAVFSYYNNVDKAPELIAINVEGILRRYKNNKYEISVSFPFKIRRAISNKKITEMKDIAMVFFKENGKSPYLFSTQYMINLTDGKKSQEELTEQILSYEKQLLKNIDQECKQHHIVVPTQSIAAAALSIYQDILVIAVDRVVTVCNIQKQKKITFAVPDFKFEQEQAINSIDITGTSLLVCSGKGMMTFDVEKRKKIAKGLVIKGKQYDLVKWAQPPSSIIYGASTSAKMKVSHCMLNVYGSEVSKSSIE